MKTNSLAEEYLKQSFIENPSYSFGDWTIMYEHSVKVKDLALRIAQEIECDEELLIIESLWHDIGKVYKADEKILRERHAELGYQVTKNFLPQLSLPFEKEARLISFLKGDLSSIEAQVVKDADIIAFYMDEKLQLAFKTWAEKNNLLNEIERKINKLNHLRFNISKQIAPSL